MLMTLVKCCDLVTKTIPEYEYTVRPPHNIALGSSLYLPYTKFPVVTNTITVYLYTSVYVCVYKTCFNEESVKRAVVKRSDCI